MVLRNVGMLVGAGLVGGGCVSVWTLRYIEALLFGVTPYDAATLVPASIDPARVLHEESDTIFAGEPLHSALATKSLAVICSCLL